MIAEMNDRSSGKGMNRIWLIRRASLQEKWYNPRMSLPVELQGAFAKRPTDANAKNGEMGKPQSIVACTMCGRVLYRA